MSPRYEILMIGGSAGSLDALLQFVPQLKNGLELAIVIVLHRKGGQDSALVDLLATKTKLPVKEVEEKELVVPNHIYIAPADYHLLFEKDKSFALDASEKVNHSRPSIDVAFSAAADVFGKTVCGLLLSGANADGAEGLGIIKAAGGLTAIQDPDTAEVSYMPQAALDTGAIDKVLKTSEIAAFINDMNQ